MFTGIVESLGRVSRLTHTVDAAVLTIEAPQVLVDAHHGDSISVNGVCLTVTTFDAHEFTVDIMAESLVRTGLGQLAEGSAVNLERAMKADARFGGHIVQGHVDGTTRITAITPGERWTRVEFELPPDLAKYVVEKGSITLNGVSLTVASRAQTSFSVSLIPTTLELTTFGHAQVGDSINVEVDVLAKYVENMGLVSASQGDDDRFRALEGRLARLEQLLEREPGQKSSESDENRSPAVSKEERA